MDVTRDETRTTTGTATTGDCRPMHAVVEWRVGDVVKLKTGTKNCQTTNFKKKHVAIIYLTRALRD